MVGTLSKVRKPVHGKCFGIELECFVPTNTAIQIEDKFLRFWYVGSDGSLHARPMNHYGLEFVSQPLPFDWLMREIAWLGKKYQWQVNRSCGIHVHVSKAGNSIKQMKRLTEGLCKLSYDECKELFGRMPNDYCRPNNFRESLIDRYSQINYANKHTYEFRMFASGDANWAKECLRRTKLMCEFKGAITYENLFELFTRPEKEFVKPSPLVQVFADAAGIEPRVRRVRRVQPVNTDTFETLGDLLRQTHNR